MSENEIKAIEIIKQEIDKNKVTDTPKEVYITDIKMLLNLVKIQQKEIETLEIIHNSYKEMIEENDYISKEKIRERIKKAKEINWHTPKLVIEYFEELLEEK